MEQTLVYLRTIDLNFKVDIIHHMCFPFRANARYVGALVADVHNILINGGIYGYPGTLKNPNGKLRLLYESAIMAMIMEQAGGAGSNGFMRILDVKPTEIHQRIPTFLGSIENVFELDQFHEYYSDEDEGDS
jgi:fructose-1,6-bisphosphatase I